MRDDVKLFRKWEIGSSNFILINFLVLCYLILVVELFDIYDFFFVFFVFVVWSW